MCYLFYFRKVTCPILLDGYKFIQNISFYIVSFIPNPLLAITKAAPICMFSFILSQNLFLAIQLVHAGFTFIVPILFLKAILVINLSYREYARLCSILLYFLHFLLNLNSEIIIPNFTAILTANSETLTDMKIRRAERTGKPLDRFEVNNQAGIELHFFKDAVERLKKKRWNMEVLDNGSPENFEENLVKILETIKEL